MGPRHLRIGLSVVALVLPHGAHGATATWPERSAWRASASAGTQAALAPAYAIDGDAGTKWGGAFSLGHWLQVDLGRAARLGGALIRWDSAYAAAYSIQASVDGRRWRTVYATADSPGGTELLAFAEVTARYVRLASAPRTADWGVSVFEFEPLSADAAPRSPAGAAVFAGRGKVSLHQPLDIALPAGQPVAGLEVDWGGPRGAARLEGRMGDGPWRLLAEDPQGEGPRSLLAAREAAAWSSLRLQAEAAGGAAPVVRRLRLLSPTRVLTPMRRYQLAAERRHAALFPDTLHAQQVYWTVVGAPAALRKSIFDEWGDVEAYKGAPLVQPLWHEAGVAYAAYGRAMTHGLRQDWMPMPWVRWSPRPGIEIESEALAADGAGGPVTWVRHRVRNRTPRPVAGRLALVVRPIQISPTWQNAGPSPIHAAAFDGDVLKVNGQRLLVSATPTQARGAAPFGRHGETEITRDLALGRMPAALQAEDGDGLAAAALGYDLELPAGGEREVIVALPLGDGEPVLPAGGYDALAARVQQQWQARLGRIGLRLPDPALVHMLRAQAAYMLVNQTGPALQAGPRNYDRSFIRDGSATAAALLRMGESRTAREYLRWYARHAVHDDGLVSPILNGDGSVNQGFGSDIEYDSQGQFIWLVAQVARLDGGPQTVREHEREVRLALRFLQQLRERTLVPGYMADAAAPERFRGIIAPSISHEGYPTPTHSYWDDYWALKGWHDGQWLLQAWGDADGAAWAGGQYAALRGSVADSLRATMRWKGADFVPAAADLGDGDPAGVSIGLDPCGQQDLMPADALARTFDRYLREVRLRDAPGTLYAYTPYELRNVLTFVRLNRPAQAWELLQRFVAGRRPAAWQVLAEVVHSQLRRPVYLGDMPHTWIGSEYARTVFGMLMHEGDEVLELMPGAPPAWLAGDGLALSDLPTARGTLTMQARRTGRELSVRLEPGLQAGTAVKVFWPDRRRPREVVVDGLALADWDADGVRLPAPFRRLTARW